MTVSSSCQWDIPKFIKTPLFLVWRHQESVILLKTPLFLMRMWIGASTILKYAPYFWCFCYQINEMHMDIP